MGEDEPTRRRIVVEILVYASLFVLVGLAFALVRQWKEGPRTDVWNVTPHTSAPATRR